MATKLKKRNPAVTFIVFFIAMNLLLVSILTGLVFFLSEGLQSAGLDYKRTVAYRQQMYGGFMIEGLNAAMYLGEADISPIRSRSNSVASTASSSLAALEDWEDVESLEASDTAVLGEEATVTQSPYDEEIWLSNESKDVDAMTHIRVRFAMEGPNMAWLIEDRNHEIFTSTDKANSVEMFTQVFRQEMENSRGSYNPMAVVPSYSGYDHVLVIKDATIYDYMNTRAGIVSTATPINQSPYASWIPVDLREAVNGMKQGEGPAVCIAVRSEGELLNNGGEIYSSYYNWFRTSQVLLALAAVAAVSLVMLLGVLIKRKSLAIATDHLAHWCGKLWLEIKLCAGVLGVIWAIIAIDMMFWNEAWPIIALPCALWLLWLLINDLRHNRKAFFTNNSIMTTLRFLRSLESKYAFCARMKRRLLILICTELVLVFLALLLLMVFGAFGTLLDFFLFGLGAFLVIHYVYNYNKSVDQLALVLDYMSQVKNGMADLPLVLPDGSDYAGMAADLNDIHNGMARMVDARLKSDQMKAELITNVSHDLKTPLTSIINYVGLLSKEELAPPYANDYVKILAGKSDRLKTLVQDLFEISKAQSGAIDFTPERLNVVALLEQTVAELDTRSTQANVEIRFQFAQPHVLVRADGKKLHRVFENLLGNALKYSLSGTRVYVTMNNNGQHVQIMFKNVAGYEMKFTEQEIVERFQRGDTARTSEGSGLGLAIAKSFMELNGGGLRVELDGDMFKAIVTLPVLGAEAPASSKPAPKPPVPMAVAVPAPAPAVETTVPPAIEAPELVAVAATVMPTPSPVAEVVSAPELATEIVTEEAPAELMEELTVETIDEEPMPTDVSETVRAAQAVCEQEDETQIPYEIAPSFESKE